MPYLGNELATQFQAFVTQTITGDGSTGYTLDRAVANGKELLVYINNVKQEEGSGKSYTASGTTITFSEAVASGDSCYVVFLGSAVQTVVPPAGSLASYTGNATFSGDVGIRTTSPSDNLELTPSADGKGVTLKTTDNIRPYLNFDANRSGAGNNVAQINFKWNGTDVAGIFAVAGADTTNKDDAHITFGTASAGSVDERMRLTSSGGLAIGSTDNNGFNLKVEGLTMLESGNNETFGQLFIHGTGSSTGDAQISMHTDSNGRAIYVDESDANTLRFSGGAGKGHSSDFKIDNSGNVTVGGSLSKGSGSFKIRHPLESKKDTHYLVHSFVEAPQADNIYRGVVALENGTAIINLDTVSGMTEGTFVALNTNTSCFTSNETDWDSVKGSITENILTITCQNSSSTANVSWLVIGERQDQHMLDNDWTDDNGKVIVEPLKNKGE